MVELECTRCGELFDSRAGQTRCQDCRGKRMREVRRAIPGRENQYERDAATYMESDVGARLKRGFQMMSGGR